MLLCPWDIWQAPGCRRQECSLPKLGQCKRSLDKARCPWKTSRPQLKTTGLKGEMRIQQRMMGAAGMTHLDGMDGREERHVVFSKHTRGGSDAGFSNNSPEEGTSA